MASAPASEDRCPVDHQSRQQWLDVAKQSAQQHPALPHSPHPHPHPDPLPHSVRPSAPSSLNRSSWYSLDAGRWQALPSILPASQPQRPKLYSLSKDREISTIPRAVSDASNLNSAEKAAMPANNEQDTGHDRDSGNWIYPSQEMFFNAMQRKGHAAEARDMASVVPIHNAVNERAWKEIRDWEKGRGSEKCGGPKLVSFAGDSKALTPRARWNSLLGYEEPFDRHDWVIDRCGTKIDYVIDFYKGKSIGGPLSFFLDVRPKLNSWEGIKMRAAKTLGL